MKYRLLGNSGLRVSEAALGAMTFGDEWGWGSAKDEAHKVYDAFREAGGNFIDTANFYTNGTSESFLGEFMRDHRQSVVLATKYTMSAPGTDPNAAGNQRKNMMQSLEASLKRLQTDYVDLYWVHMWDQITPVEEVMRGLDDLIRQGKGGLRRRVEVATDEVQAAEAEHLGTRISIVSEAADAYMQIRGTQARLFFTGEQIVTDEHLLELVFQRRAAGIASDREQAQAEAVLAQARATVPQLAIILEAQLNRLDVLTGAQPGTYAAELRAPADIPVIPAIAVLANPTELLRRRPDIVAAERRVAASNARIGQSLAEYYPKISLSGFLGNEAISPGNLFRERGFQPSAVAGLRWRLFDFGRVNAEVRQAKGANAEALLQFRSSVLRAAEDVENSFTLLAQSEVRSDEILREIGALQRVRDRSQEAYQAGAIGLTDVLDADRQLLVARDDLALTNETVARAAVGSFRALGGGWAP